MAMSAPSASDQKAEKNNDRHSQVMVGELPADFLRVTPMTNEQQFANDEQTAIALQQQLSGNFVPGSNVTGRLSVSVIEAKLVKNYGMTRMDPYVRLRIGHTVYETHTDHNGAKNPRWNKVFHCFLFPNVTSLYIEIFDECAFTLDEKVAWAHYTLPETVLQGDTLDEWIPLNGKQGDGKEGSINLVMTYMAIPAGTMVYPPQPLVAVMPTPYYVTPGVPYAPQAYAQYPAVQGQVQGQPVARPQTVQPPPPEIKDEDVQQVKEMFPNLEEDVIKSVMISENGNKDRTINALLVMSEGS